MKVKRKNEETAKPAEPQVMEVKGGALVPQQAGAVALTGQWADELAQSAKDESAVETPAVQAFSTRAGVLSYNNQPVPENKLNVIIVGSAFINSFFINKFDPTNIVPPLCFAISEKGEDMEPHENSFKKQGGEEHLCLGCPYAEWGSDENSPSGRGKACKETRRLVVIPEDSLKEGIEKASMAIFNVPVTSVGAWSAYVHMLAATAKRPAWSVVTEISLRPDPKKQFVVSFACVDAVNDVAQLAALKDIRERAQQVATTPFAMMTEEQFKDITDEKEKPKAKRKF